MKYELVWLNYIADTIKLFLVKACSSSSCTVTGLTFDSDRVLKLIPEWARSVSTRIRHACFAIFEINPFLFLKCMYRHHLRTVGALLNRKW